MRPRRLSIGLLGPAPGVNAFYWVSGVLVLTLVLILVRARWYGEEERDRMGWERQDSGGNDSVVWCGVRENVCAERETDK